MIVSLHDQRFADLSTSVGPAPPDATYRATSSSRNYWNHDANRAARSQFRRQKSAGQPESAFGSALPEPNVARAGRGVVGRTKRELSVRTGCTTLILPGILVGAAGFEPTTPSPPDWCANRAALRSEHQGPDGPGLRQIDRARSFPKKHRRRGALSASGSGEKFDRAVSTDFRAMWQFKTCSTLCAR